MAKMTAAAQRAVVATGNKNFNSNNDGNENWMNVWELRHTEIECICLYTL